MIRPAATGRLLRGVKLYGTSEIRRTPIGREIFAETARACEPPHNRPLDIVIAGLDPAIHAALELFMSLIGCPGQARSSPAMTIGEGANMKMCLSRLGLTCAG